MNNEAIRTMLEQLATRLGTTLENLWTMLVWQARIDAAARLTTDLALVCLLLAAWRLALKIPFDKWEDGEFFKALLYVVLGIATAGCAVFVAGLMPHHIAQLCNPEYWALKQITN